LYVIVYEWLRAAALRMRHARLVNPSNHCMISAQIGEGLAGGEILE
jgi:hypothetical protein